VISGVHDRLVAQHYQKWRETNRRDRYATDLEELCECALTPCSQKERYLG
jgi:hypothetical protein